MRTRMIRRGVWCALAALVASALPLRADDAADLMRRVSAQYRSVTNEREDLDVILIATAHADPYTRAQAATLAANGGRGVTHKHAVRRIAYATDRKDRAHLLLTQPADDAGTEFLVLRGGADGSDEQRLYSPVLKRARLVAAGDKNPFVGTTFSLEDIRELTGERVERWDYRTVETSTHDGRATAVVEAVPRPGTESSYASRMLWIDTQRSFPVRIEYRDPAGKPWKVLRNSALQEVLAGVWRSDLVEMRDVQLGEATLLLVTRRTVDADLPPHLFEVNQLGSGDAAD